MLDSVEFQDWVAGSGCSTLFCPAMPGAGRTIAASAVVQELMSRFGQDPDVGITHIYFDALRREQQRLKDVCLSLAEHLIQRLSDTALSDSDDSPNLCL